MNRTDMLATFKAIEFLTYGIDVSNFTYEQLKGYVNARDKKYITKISPNVTDFVIELSADAVEFLRVPNKYICRHEKSFKSLEEMPEGCSINTVVNKDIFISTMQILYKSRAVSFEGVPEEILDPELKERLEKIDKTFNRKAPINNNMIETLTIDATRKYFNTMTALTFKETEVPLTNLINAYNSRYASFDIEGFKDYPIYDNRLYIPLSEADKYRAKSIMGDKWKAEYNDMDYIVISKNLYDYYYCSYGSAFQSCFSITSSHAGFVGMISLGVFKDHYIIYGTKKHSQKVSMDNSGSKWVAPFMFFRNWGWISTDGKLLVDKTYASSNEDHLFDAYKPLMKSLGMSFEDSPTRQASEMKKYFNDYPYRFYPDSIRISDFSFHREAGSKSFCGTLNPFFKKLTDNGTLKSALTLINNIDDSFDPLKPFVIVDGRIYAPKKCPITNLDIPETESKSFYSKFLLQPVKSMAVFSYVDGFIKLDAATQDCNDCVMTVNCTCNVASAYCDKIFTKKFNVVPVQLTAFKEWIKSKVNSSKYDLILLRVVDNDKVNYIKYKKSGVR